MGLFACACFTCVIWEQITKHHEALLFQAASLKGLGSDLSAVRRGLVEVESSVTR